MIYTQYIHLKHQPQVCVPSTRIVSRITEVHETLFLVCTMINYSCKNDEIFVAQKEK